MFPQIFCTALLLSAAPRSAAAQTIRLPPDWKDVDVVRYLSERERGQAGMLSGPMTAFATPLVLPALGLPGDPASTPAVLSANGFVDPARTVSRDWWPVCATALDGAPQTASDDTGTWYSAVYDYRCLMVTVSGDLNSQVVVPAAMREELSESRGDVASSVDEADVDGQLREIYSVTYDFVRFNVPYSVTIECQAESLTLCRDREAQHNLLARLIIVAGEPRP